MDYRSAAPEDQSALQAFTCDTSGARYEAEVEAFIQTRAWAWSLGVEGDPRLLVITEPDGDLIGVVAHRRTMLTVTGRAQAVRKIEVLALQTAYQGVTQGGVRHSSALISAALTDIGARDGDVATMAIVHSSNIRSIRLLARAGLANLAPYAPPYVLVYS